MAAPTPTAAMNGAELAVALAKRYPGEDWLAALAKSAVMPRGEVERHLQASAPPPGSLLRAIEGMDAALDPPDPQATDDVFAASTNDRDAQLEVDSEAGHVVLPHPKPSPSKSNSPNELGTRTDEHMVDDSLRQPD